MLEVLGWVLVGALFLATPFAALVGFQVPYWIHNWRCRRRGLPEIEPPFRLLRRS